MGWLSSSAPKPDKNIGIAARQAQELAGESLDWFRQEYDATRSDREAAEAQARLLAQTQLATMDEQNRIAREEREYQTGTFRPLERELIDKATSYDTEARREEEAGRAGAEVRQAIDGQLGSQARGMQRMGVNPNSGKFATMQNATAIQGALGEAAAKNNARRAVETQGFARMADVANMGRGLSSSQNAAVATGIGAGQASLGASGQALDARMSGSGLMSTGFGLGMQGLQTAGNLYKQAQPAPDSGGFGDLLGGLGGLGTGLGAMGLKFSDKNMKKGTGKTGGTASMLEAVKSTPVHRDWKYDEDKGGPDDDEPHTGPMAQDVRKHMGEGAAPGGKVIDLISMNGVTMGAIQEIAKRLERLEKEAA